MPAPVTLDVEVKPGHVTAYLGNGEAARFTADEARQWATALAVAADAAAALAAACATAAPPPPLKG